MRDAKPGKITIAATTPATTDLSGLILSQDRDSSVSPSMYLAYEDIPELVTTLWSLYRQQVPA